MDFFGISTALKGVLSVYFRSARASGRTTRLVESVTDQDAIVTVDANQARELRRLLDKRKCTAAVIVMDARRPNPTAYHRTPGRTIMDHTWVEAFYMAALEQAESEIRSIERYLSGDSLEPLATPDQFHARNRWGSI